MGTKNRVDYIAVEEDAVLKFQFALIDAMNEAGLTKADLAKALGVSKARVSQMLDSEANPTLKVIARAMVLLDYEMEYCSLKAKRAASRHKNNHVGGLTGLRAIIQDLEPAWAIREERPKAAANQDRYWDYVQAA